jgi:hypothetical protein
VDKDLTTEEKIDLAIATEYTKALAQGWKECFERAAAKVMQDAFKQSEEKNGGAI